jgi:hypothetical protein
MYRAFTPVFLVLAACSHENELVADDFREPTLELTTPAQADWMPAGRVSVDGRAENLERVNVNGVEARPDRDGRFSTEVVLERGINVVEASGTDGHGDTRFVRHGVLAGDFGDPGTEITDAVRLRVNQGGLDVAMDTVAGMLDAGELGPTVMSGNPVYQDSYGVWGWDAVNIRADVTELWFDQPTLTADPETGYLDIGAQIPNVWVKVVASGDVVGWDFSVDVWVWASRADLTAWATVDAQAGKLKADLRDASVTLVGFGYDTSLLPGEVEQYILVDAVRGYLEGKLAETLEAKVPPMLDETLAGLELSFDTTVMDREVHVAAEIAEAGIDDRGIEIDANLDVSIPGKGDKTYTGYLLAGEGRPEADENADIGLALSDDLLNRLLFEVWRAGVLDMTLSTEDGSLQPIMLAPLHATEGSIEIASMLPPVIVEKEGRLQAQLGELEVVIRTPGGEMGEYLKASVAAFVELELTVENGVLKLDLGTPELSVTVRESDWGASNETTTNLLEEMLPIDTFMLLLGDIEFPLPTLGTVSIAKGTVSRTSNHVYTGVSVDLK